MMTTATQSAVATATSENRRVMEYNRVGGGSAISIRNELTDDFSFPGQRHIQADEKTHHQTPHDQCQTASKRKLMEDKIVDHGQDAGANRQQHLQKKLPLGLVYLFRRFYKSFFQRTVQCKRHSKRNQDNSPQRHGGHRRHKWSDLATVDSQDD